MRGWLVGLGIVAITGAVGAGWGITTWGELVVVEPNAAPDLNALATATTTTTSPSMTTSTSVPTAATTVPACTIADQPAEGDPAADWATILVDATYGLPSTFEPNDLADVSLAGFRSDDQVREVVLPDLKELQDAATANDTPLELVSAYRSYTYQDGLFNRQVEAVGLEEAQRTSARAGHSEHQLGTTVDVAAPDTAELDATFAQTPTGQWLAANAHTYGFVLSYPDVPQERSCYGFEPWHLRYVGRDIAAQVQASGLTLREWLHAN